MEMCGVGEEGVPKGRGESEFFRGQATRLSSRVVKKSAEPEGIVSSGRELATVKIYQLRPFELPGEPLSELHRVTEARQVGHSVEIDDPVEVVDLVLEDARVKTL